MKSWPNYWGGAASLAFVGCIVGMVVAGWMHETKGLLTSLLGAVFSGLFALLGTHPIE